ncbi:glycoside hydrolase N-terminal domain-containing protein [Georgenia sp. M64]|uniref:glycosyl hydrolase family 95 catalytic domain-containing protein n=1 Tax=Georgenia sp. M64 TaxID=3120520 RepID=UPI0030E037F5
MTRHVIRLDTPAPSFIDSFLLGDGRLGAALRGLPGTEEMNLNLDTLWSGGPGEHGVGPEDAGARTRDGDGDGPPADVEAPGAALLTEIRAAVAGGDLARAEELARRNQSGRWTQAYQPVGRLRWTYATGADGSAYARELDLRDGVARTMHDGVTVETFVSAPAGVLVSRATGPVTGAGAVAGTAGSEAAVAVVLDTPHPVRTTTTTDEAGRAWTVVTGRAPVTCLPDYVDHDEPVTYADDQPDADGSVAAGMGFAVVAVTETVPGGLRLVVAGATGFRGWDRRPGADVESLAQAARDRVGGALARRTEDLLAEHVADRRRLVDRVDLDLSASGDDAAAHERAFDLGRHLLVSSSRPGTQAANLQGIWNADARPAWSGNYTTNINLEMAYWPAELLDLAELHTPLLDLVRDLAVAGTGTARRYYGARGAAVHHNTDLWRFTEPVDGEPQWAAWPSALWWLARHLVEHVDFAGSGAERTARTVGAVAVLRAGAAFALDMLVDDGRGALVVSPSTSPEHRFVLDGGAQVAVGAGAAMDQELVREVLTSYLALAEDDPGEAALAAEARSALPRLREVQVGRAGDLLEWADERRPAEPGHRHVSQLYGAFPGSRITATREPALLEAVRRALALRLANGSGYTGWSQAWILCLAARLRDTALAEHSIDVLLRTLTSASGLDLHPHEDWPDGQVFQIDGNLGVVAGMVELLVQSHDGAVSLLPALPDRWPTGRLTGVRARGGHQVDVRWSGGRLDAATVTAGDGPLVLEVPERRGPAVVVSEGAVVPTTAVVPAAPGCSRLTFPAQPGAVYSLTFASR